MKSRLKFIVLVFILLQCKAKKNLPMMIHEHKFMDSEMYLSSQKDTISGNKNDTVIIYIPVEFNKGRFWSQGDTITQISFFKQDEAQHFDGQELKDFQRFYYMFKDTGLFVITYLLQSPIGKDTTIYSIREKYFIINNK